MIVFGIVVLVDWFIYLSILHSPFFFLFLVDLIVAESVVVIKKLLQMLRDNEEHNATMKEVISHLVKLLPNLTSPKARASILWVIGEYNHKVPKMAPDVLRQLAKSFPDEVNTRWEEGGEEEEA